MVDAVRSYAPAFIFSTAMPPAIAAAATASVRHLSNSKAERTRNQERAATLRRMLLNAGLPVLVNQSHIVPVMVGDRSEQHTSALQSLMRISYAVFCLHQKTTRVH